MAIKQVENKTNSEEKVLLNTWRRSKICSELAKTLHRRQWRISRLTSVSIVNFEQVNVSFEYKSGQISAGIKLEKKIILIKYIL